MYLHLIAIQDMLLERLSILMKTRVRHLTQIQLSTTPHYVPLKSMEQLLMLSGNEKRLFVSKYPNDIELE